MECSGLNQDEVICSLRTNENKEDSKLIKINMTCGSDFRLKKLYLLLHIFLTFSRENSRLGTSLQMMKSVWSHLNSISPSHLSFLMRVAILEYCIMPKRPYGIWRLRATTIAVASMGHGSIFFYYL